MTNKAADYRELLDRLDLGEIDRLRQAKQAVTYLEGQKQLLQTKLAELDDQIAKVKTGALDPAKVLPRKTAAGGAPALQSDVVGQPPRLPRRARTGTLREKIIEVLRAKNAPLPIADIAQAVTAAGYETSSQNFAQQVAMTLSKMQELERVERGIYRLKPPTA